jgi:CheY-like chemotaxis protein
MFFCYNVPGMAARSEKLRTAEGGLSGRIILFIDDEESLTHFLPFPLQSRGATVITASNGQEALEIIQKNLEGNNPHLDLIITDFEMPLMDGEELLDALGESNDTKNIPFIFSSGGLREEQKKRLSENPQVKSLLKKPFSFDELITAAKEALK